MNLKDLNFEEVKELAGSVEGFTYHHKTGEEKLKEDLAVYLEANQDKIPKVCDDNPPVIPDGPAVQDDEDDSGEMKDNKPLKDEDEEENTPDVPEKNDAKSDGKVKIQSDYRGEIGSSFGMMDFGTDGICEVSPECAEMLCTLKGYKKC